MTQEIIDFSKVIKIVLGELEESSPIIYSEFSAFSVFHSLYSARINCSKD